MQKRLCGREQEFGMRIVFKRTDSEYGFGRKEDVALRLIAACSKVAPGINSERRGGDYCWFCNGALIYLDSGLIEASTAEYYAGTLDGVIQEKALEWILNQSAKSAVKSSKAISLIALYKNNVGYDEKSGRKEVTYGSHHNYSFLREKQERIFQLMQNFIPVSLPLTGNGHIFKLKPKKKFIYCLSQRANHVSMLRGIDGSVCERRPIVHFKTESLRGHGSFGNHRLHLISRDATRCEFQTWLVDAMSHLVLRLAEEEWEFPPKLAIAKPIEEMHRFNANKLNLDYKLKTRSRSIDAIAYNYLFLNAAKQLNPLSPDEKKCLEEWERVLELLKAKAFEKLVGELDWVTKWYLLKNKMKKYGFGLDDVRAWKIDMNYHDISDSPKQSWFALLEEGGYIRHLVSKSDIKKAITTPPETRAKSRGEFIQKCRENPYFARKVLFIEWDKAQIGFGDEVIYF